MFAMNCQVAATCGSVRYEDRGPSLSCPTALRRGDYAQSNSATLLDVNIATKALLQWRPSETVNSTLIAGNQAQGYTEPDTFAYSSLPLFEVNTRLCSEISLV